jgi:SAM-dependent methyltransferase
MKLKLICPYCGGQCRQTGIAKPSRALGWWGVLSCGCDQYPVVEGIAFVQKNETKTNRVIVKYLENRDYQKAVKFGLSRSGRFYGSIMYGLWLWQYRYGSKIPVKYVLGIMSRIGARKSWYQFVNKRESWGDIGLGMVKLKDTLEGVRILDLGCGVGQSMSELERYGAIVTGIDKNFEALLFGRIYYSIKGWLLCADVEQGLPFSNEVFGGVTLFEVLPWIFNKRKLESECRRLLIQSGWVYASDIGDKESPWGYGISQKDLRNMFRKYWRRLQVSERGSLKGDPVNGSYNFYAERI